MRVRSMIVVAFALVVALLAAGCGDDDSAADDSAADETAGADAADSAAAGAADDGAADDGAADDGAAGDGAAGDGAAGDGAADDAGTDDGAADEEPSADDSSSSAGAPGTGTMTVGDLSYELEVSRCVTLAGAIAADAVAVDEPDNVSVSISLSPEDWRDRPASEGWTANGSLRLDIDEPYQQWEAGVEALEGYNLPGPATLEDFAIASYDVSDDGQSAQGEASFASIDALLRGEPLEPTPGTFEITCPES